MALIEITSPAELPDEPLVTWAAQRLGPAVRAWRSGDAVAVASLGLSGRDRLAVTGAPATVAILVQHAFAELGPSLRPIGAASLITALCARAPSLGLVAKTFGWMQTDVAPPPDDRARLLADVELPTVAGLLDAAFPDSHARPGRPGVRRWWGTCHDGRLAAVTADAWSAPALGFVAGVATLDSARGRGLGRVVVTTAVHTLVREHGWAALMVDSDNTAARRLYASLGMRFREIAAARST